MRVPHRTEYGDPDANMAGFWDPISALIDWCEENYVTSPYIAEFWNTISNIGYFLLMIVVFTRSKNNDVHTRLYSLSLLLLAIGSSLFHATLRYDAQMLDEGPMVLLLVNTVVDTLLLYPRFQRCRPKISGLFVVSLSFIISVINMALKSRLFIPICTFVLLNLHLAFTLYLCRKQLIPIRYMSIGSVLCTLGFICWNIDSIFCMRVRYIRHLIHPFGFLLQGHMWWHILTAIGVYFYQLQRTLTHNCMKGKTV